jgi:hypothetical protein
MRNHVHWLLACALLLFQDCTLAAEPAPPASVMVNGQELDQTQLALLLQRYGTPVAPGRYWYDPRTGFWGHEGGPTRGQLQAGEPVGGPLAADASGRGSGVFVNGRELHAQDVQQLDALFALFGTRTLPGRYWADAQGNFGTENPPRLLGNLRAMARESERRGAPGKSGYRNNPWSYTTDYSSLGGGDGASFYERKRTYGPDKGHTSVYVDADGSVSYDTPARDP